MTFSHVHVHRVDECHLLGKAEAQEEAETSQYRYKLGEAIVFGDNFMHATQTGQAPNPLGFHLFLDLIWLITRFCSSSVDPSRFPLFYFWQ